MQDLKKMEKIDSFDFLLIKAAPDENRTVSAVGTIFIAAIAVLIFWGMYGSL